MNKVVMSSEILDIIHAVIDYKHFICSQNMLKQFHEDNFNWYTKAKEYYHSLILPEGLKKNIIDFEKILNYENDTKKLDILDSTENCNLGKYYF